MLIRHPGLSLQVVRSNRLLNGKILFLHPVRPESHFVEDTRRILPTDLTAPDLSSNNSSTLIWKEPPKQAWENPSLPKERVFQNMSPSRLSAFFYSWHSFPADLFLLSVWVGLALFFPKRSLQSFLPGRVSRVKVLLPTLRRTQCGLLSRVTWRQGWLLSLPERRSLGSGWHHHFLPLEYSHRLWQFIAYKLHF